MARVKKQKRREKRGEWVRSTSRSQRWRKQPTGRFDPVARALRAVEATESSWSRERGRRLVAWLWDREHEALLDARLVQTLATLPWPACPRDRLPRQAPESREGLVRLLLERRPLPPILLVWADPTEPSPRGDPMAHLASHVGGGGTLAQAKERGLVPDDTTRRVYRMFLRGPVGRPELLAWRRAEARSAGLPMPIADLAVLECRYQPGERHLLTARSWLPTFRWLARHDLDGINLHLVIRFLANQELELGGRTVASVQRLAMQWVDARRMRHRPQGEVRPCADAPTFPSCRLRSLDDDDAGWSLEEILRPLDLWREGERMRHCVYGYRRRIRDGRSSIWTLSRHGHPCLTVEVEPRRRAIVQAKGVCNRVATPDELSVLAAWAALNGLRMSV